MDELSRLPERSGRCAGAVETQPALALTAGCADHYGALAEVKACFISLTQLAVVCLGLGIQVADPGHLDEFFLRLLEARDSDAGPAFAPGPLLLRPLRTRPLLRRAGCPLPLLGRVRPPSRAVGCSRVLNPWPRAGKWLLNDRNL
jgi:hypothetical protein